MPGVPPRDQAVAATEEAQTVQQPIFDSLADKEGGMNLKDFPGYRFFRSGTDLARDWA
jgi:hypothetical protein